MRVYISGPITGMVDRNQAAFVEAADMLRDLDHDPVNPQLIQPEHDGECRGAYVEGHDHRYGCFMRADLKALLDCDAITMLRGWEASPGARCELDVARLCSLVIMELYED